MFASLNSIFLPCIAATPFNATDKDGFAGSSITIENVRLVDNHQTTARQIQFDIQWRNSWRENSGRSNWDAAWVFVKYRLSQHSAWHHASLSPTANDFPTSATNSTPPALAPSSDGKGVFLYRAEEGHGSVRWENVSLIWNTQADRLPLDAHPEIKVLALEMVYIPAGEFYLGDGFSAGRFHAGGDAQSPYLVTSKQILLSNKNGGLWAENITAVLPGGGNAQPTWDNVESILPTAYPTGYQGFYVMKYELTQGQWVTFLNMLTPAQARIFYVPEDFLLTYRFLPFPYRARNTITFDAMTGLYVTTSPHRSVNWLGWEDAIAFLDWAALRPITEMEYEKICRGAGQTPVPGEYCWGTTYLFSLTSFDGSDGSGTENALPIPSNTLAERSIQGPVRTGIHESKATRELQGAAYYGALDLSGNIGEIVVTAGTAAGRFFDGRHGDGELDEQGAANVVLWPRVLGFYQNLNTHQPESYWPWVTAGKPPFNGISQGWGWRGGDWMSEGKQVQTFSTSARHFVTTYTARRLPNQGGGRGARTMP